MRTLLLCLCLLVSVSISADRKKSSKSKKQKQETEKLTELGQFQPDALIAPLTPQPPLDADNANTLKADVRHHIVNRKLQGIDVSHYQNRINWKEVARCGEVDYVYVKATEGAQLVDDTYRFNLNGARKAGLKVGIYHFYRPTADVRLQFQNLSSTVSHRDMDLIPIVDVEHRGKEPLAKFQNKLKRFIDMVERHYGVKPILYTSRDFYNKYLSGPFTDYKYMIARYHPEVPELCDDAAFVMWQYAATGRVSGIRGNVDRSCFMDQFTLRDIEMP